jgi:hypothetical protein
MLGALTLLLAPFLLGYSHLRRRHESCSFLVGVVLLEESLLTQWRTSEELASFEA